MPISFLLLAENICWQVKVNGRISRDFLDGKSEKRNISAYQLF